MAYFSKTLETLREVAQHTAAINASGGLPTAGSPGAAAGRQRLDPAAVAEALAEAMKSKNSTTEAISVRSANISDQLGGKRAY